MIYGREGETVFLHGARKSRVIRLLESTERACVNVTLLDGIVVARSVFNSSMNYRSVTVFGKPQLVESREDKLHGMHVISEHTIPGRWAEVRDSHEREIKMTGVISMQIEAASAKVSSGMPETKMRTTTFRSGPVYFRLQTGLECCRATIACCRIRANGCDSGPTGQNLVRAGDRFHPEQTI